MSDDPRLQPNFKNWTKQVQKVLMEYYERTEKENRINAEKHIMEQVNKELANEQN